MIDGNIIVILIIALVCIIGYIEDKRQEKEFDDLSEAELFWKTAGRRR